MIAAAAAVASSAAASSAAAAAAEAQRGLLILYERPRPGDVIAINAYAMQF